MRLRRIGARDAETPVGEDGVRRLSQHSVPRPGDGIPTGVGLLLDGTAAP